jgi:hypothetical protein
MSETFKEPTPIQHYQNYCNMMNELDIHSELIKVNNIHHSLDAENIMTYIILLETNKSKLSQGQILWINERIALLNLKQSKQVVDSLSHVDLDLAKMPLLEKCSDRGYLQENPSTNHTENYGLVRDV